MRPGDPAGKVGDRRDHGGPCLGRRVLVRTIIAARVEIQISGSPEIRNAALPQIRRYDRAWNRLRHADETPSGFGRSMRCRRQGLERGLLRFRRRHAEEDPGLVSDILEVDEAAALANHVEEVSMLAGSGVSPFPGGAFGRVLEPDVHRAALGVAGVAHLPVVALTVAIAEIAAAHRLGLSAETLCEIGCVETGHHAASRSPTRWIG